MYHEDSSIVIDWTTGLGYTDEEACIGKLNLAECHAGKCKDNALSSRGCGLCAADLVTHTYR